MAFYLIGLGLDLKSISLEALEILQQCKKIYLETYTVEFPYPMHKLEEVVGNRVIPLTRLLVEREEFLEEARNKDIALLIYGSPLIATTHTSLILKCKKEDIDYRILHNASIFDVVTETGLHIYKFGKTTSMPKWEKNYNPTSFVDIIKENKKILAHTLILVDIGLSFPDALDQLRRSVKGIGLGKFFICSRLGTEEARIYYNNIKELESAEVYAPFCFIVPGKMHFSEEEFLE